MSYLYSPSTGGLYLPGLHGSAIPPDAVELPEDLLEALGNGATLEADESGDLQPIYPAPISPVPRSVTRYQAHAALIEAGLLDAVNAFFSALPDGDLNKLAWQEAPTVQRYSDATLLAAEALGITAEQMDTLFIRAGTY